MKLSLVFLVSFVISSSLFGKIHHVDCGGTKFEIKEKNLITLMKNYVKANKKDIQSRFKKQYSAAKKKFLSSYKPKNLTIETTPATKDAIYYPDPSYTLQMDIKDANGRILYPKGFTFNPLHYISLHGQYIFFDSTYKEQVEWIKKNHYNKDFTKKLILVNGNIFKVKKDLGAVVFFASDKILKRFDIKRTPAVVEQTGDRIKVVVYKLNYKEKR